MTSHLYRFVRGKALISSVFAIALFSGLALILSQGRDTGILSVIFLVAGIVASCDLSPRTTHDGIIYHAIA